MRTRNRRMRAAGRRLVTPGGGGAPLPAAELVAFYRFDSSLTDSTGHSHDFSIDSGTPAYQTTLGLINDSLFAITTISADLSGLFLPSGPLSLSVWVRSSVIGTAGTGMSVKVVSGSNSYGIGPIAVGAGTGSAVPLTGTGGTIRAGVSGELPNSVLWNHLVVVFNGLGGWAFYLNGSPTDSGTDTPVGLGTGTLRLIGGVNKLMCIDLLGVYSLALSAGDVTALYNGGAGFDPTA